MHQIGPACPGLHFWCARHGAQRRDWRYPYPRGGGAATWEVRVLLHTRQGEVLAERQGCPERSGIRRKPQANCWFDEQQADIGCAVWVSRPRDVVPRTCTERRAVNPTDTAGRSRALPWESCTPAARLLTSQDAGMGAQQSAEVVLAPRHRWCEGPNLHERIVTRDLCTGLIVIPVSPDSRHLGWRGTPAAVFERVSRPAGDTMNETKLTTAPSVAEQETPDT
jgi:hypothetical protein